MRISDWSSDVCSSDLAIAVSMILFLDVAPEHIIIASFVLLVFGLAFTFMGGLNSVIWSDLVQVVLYVGAAIFVVLFLLSKIPAPAADIYTALAHPQIGRASCRERVCKFG